MPIGRIILTQLVLDRISHHILSYIHTIINDFANIILVKKLQILCKLPVFLEKNNEFQFLHLLLLFIGPYVYVHSTCIILVLSACSYCL